MVLTTGIVPTPSLQETLNETSSVTSKTRFIRAEINSSFTACDLGCTHPSSGETDNKEFDNNIQHVLKEGCPQYIYYKKDDRRWIIINYIPEGLQPKQKMCYASSMEAMKEAFDPSRVSHTVTVNCREDLTWESIFKMYLDHSDKMNLLSESEKRKMQALRDEEDARSAQIKARENNPMKMNSGPAGLMFPFTEEAQTAIRLKVKTWLFIFIFDSFATFFQLLLLISSYEANQKNYCRFKIDTKKEIITLHESSSNATCDSLAQSIPNTCATFNLFKFVLQEEDKEDTHNILALCVPMGIQLPIKEKMLNASCKNGITSALQDKGITIHQNARVLKFLKN